MIHNLFLAIIDSTKYSYYFGTTDLNLFESCFFFGYVGVLAMVLMDVGSRDIQTGYSPIEFSWAFFLKDNIVKFILEIILVALAIRFLPEFLHVPMTQFNALILGLGADRLAAMAKTDRDSLLPFKSDKKSEEDTIVPITAQNAVIGTINPVSDEPKVDKSDEATEGVKNIANS